jgi:hypothetical protein
LTLTEIPKEKIYFYQEDSQGLVEKADPDLREYGRQSHGEGFMVLHKTAKSLIEVSYTVQLY